MRNEATMMLLDELSPCRVRLKSTPCQMRCRTATGSRTFLDAAREGGSINMFATVPLRKIYGLDGDTAKRVLVAWTKTFDREHAPRWRAEKHIRDMILADE
jgi:hypothetical protein